MDHTLLRPHQLFVVAAFLCAVAGAHAQSNTWTQKNDMCFYLPNGPEVGTSYPHFAIGEKGYMLCRQSANKFWEYDPATDAWAPRAQFPGTPRSAAACFVINGKGYVVGGIGSANELLADVWQFEPLTDTWTQKADFAGGARRNAVGFSALGKGYVTTGYGTAHKKDLWEYDPATNSWLQKADIPSTAREGATSFSVANKGYVGGGAANSIFFNDFHEYDPLTGLWTTRANMLALTMCAGFNIGNKGYVATGGAGVAGSQALWEFDPSTNTWATKATFIGSERWAAIGFATSTKAYVGGGWVYGGYIEAYNDFFEYNPATNSWTKKRNIGGQHRHDAVGFSIGQKGYFGMGAYTSGQLGKTDWWEYEPQTDQWTQRGNAPLARLGAVNSVLGGMGYVGTGQFSSSGTNTMYKYDPASDAWTAIAGFGGGIRRQAVSFGIAGKGYVGTGLDGTYKNDLWEHDPVTNSWSQKASLPGPARSEAVAFSIGGKGYIGTGFNGAVLNDLWQYDPVTNAWTQKASLPGPARSRAVAFVIGARGYVATGLNGTDLNDLWEYDPGTDTWTQRADLGGMARSSAIGFSIGHKGYLGAGMNKPDFWEYAPIDAASAVKVSPKVFLEGPNDSGTGLMNDALRASGLVPLAEPYTALNYAHAMGGGEATSPAVLAVTGNNAVVDWVVVELRHASMPSLVVASSCALLQRDGDVVGTDGISPVQLFVGAGSYYVSVRHRNHLGAMTANTVTLSPTTTTVNLSSSATATYGTNARKTVGSVQVLWAGNPFRDTIVRYTGSNNDRDPILVKVGGTTPNNSVNGYWLEDVNMDGSVKYTGANNDRDPILVNVGSTTPNNTRQEQLP